MEKEHTHFHRTNMFQSGKFIINVVWNRNLSDIPKCWVNAMKSDTDIELRCFSVKEGKRLLKFI